MHSVPIVYGMTIGEYAKMINGEGWLSDGIKCDLEGNTLEKLYPSNPLEIPQRPSPNLPNAHSIALYPSLCLLEPTVISVGRGTEMQFQIYGHPELPKTNFSFTPIPNYGSKNPKLKNQLCHGSDLRNIDYPKIELQWLIQAYRDFPDKKHFFKKGFNRIAGNKRLQIQLAQGLGEEQIRKTWEKDLEKFQILEKISHLPLISFMMIEKKDVFGNALWDYHQSPGDQETNYLDQSHRRRPCSNQLLF